MSPRLPNYLRSHRKRLAFSQDEVAYLLGSNSGAKVSRYEHFAREPSLQTALTCEAIFQRPASELFAGPYQEIEEAVVRRARTLLQEIKERTQNKRTAQKCQALADIINRSNKA